MDKVIRNKQNRPSIVRYSAKTYEKVELRIKKNGDDGLTRETIRSAAAAAGQSVNQWILEAIRDKL